jgi:hypothetical protein
MQPVAPAFTRYTGEMHLPADKLERLAVKQEIPLPYFKCMRLGKRCKRKKSKAEGKVMKVVFHFDFSNFTTS